MDLQSTPRTLIRAGNPVPTHPHEVLEILGKKAKKRIYRAYSVFLRFMLDALPSDPAEADQVRLALRLSLPIDHPDRALLGNDRLEPLTRPPWRVILDNTPERNDRVFTRAWVTVHPYVTPLGFTRRNTLVRVILKSLSRKELEATVAELARRHGTAVPDMDSFDRWDLEDEADYLTAKINGSRACGSFQEKHQL